jgi:hypothetical protein
MIGETALTSTALATGPAWLGDIAGHFAAAGGMADVDGVLQVQRIGQRRHIGDIGVHVMSGRGLGRAAMATAVMGDDAIAFGRKNIICASQSSLLSGQPWWKTMGWASFAPQSL